MSKTLEEILKKGKIKTREENDLVLAEWMNSSSKYKGKAWMPFQKMLRKWERKQLKKKYELDY